MHDTKKCEQQACKSKRNVKKSARLSRKWVWPQKKKKECLEKARRDEKLIEVKMIRCFELALCQSRES